MDRPAPPLARRTGPRRQGRARRRPVRTRGGEGRAAEEGRQRGPQGAPRAAGVLRGRRAAALCNVEDPAGAVSAPDAHIPDAIERGRAEMDRLIESAVQVARRVGKGAAALALHYSGARELLSTVQRRAVGGRRVLILSYHRVVGDFAQEAKRSLYTLNIEQKTFRRHLEVLQESHDVVSLDEALSVLDGTRQAARDVAVVTFDDG